MIIFFMYRIALIISLLIGPIAVSQDAYIDQRMSMVSEQIEKRGISSLSTLKAMRKVPRHLFVPAGYQSSAYMDSPLPIGYKQTISQPYIVAYMTDALQLNKKDKVLEIGTGSGYQAAVLGEIVDEVYTIEIVEPLGKRAKILLTSLGYDNVNVKVGDGFHGWPEAAPFDAIVVTAGAEEIPQPLIDQLAEGGKMIIPVGPHGGVRMLQLVTKRKGQIKVKNKLPVRFVPFTRNNN